MTHITERTDKARAAILFAKIITRDAQTRPTVVLVPGSEMKSYKVIIRRNGKITVECLLSTSGGDINCQGNRKVVCYHCMAALMIASEQGGKRVSFCADENCATLLARTGGEVYEVHSTYNDARPVWMVVKTPASKRDAQTTDSTARFHNEQAEREQEQSAGTNIRKLQDAQAELGTGVDARKYTPADWEQAEQQASIDASIDNERWAQDANEMILDGTDDRPMRHAERKASDYVEYFYNLRKSREHRATLDAQLD